jgi:tetratricopeptide (TPR) repeat protein
MTFKKSVMATLPYIGVFIVYYAIRASIVAPMNEDSNADLLNNPYAAATKIEKLATEISTASNYLRLLVFPHPLSADYSYNTIPYKDFSHPLVWLSLILHFALIRGFFYYYKRRNLLSFAIAFYLSHLALVCNLFFDIGATMGERLIYHSSVGFCIAAAYFLYEGMLKIKPESTGKLAMGGLLCGILVLCSFVTVKRNTEWKNNFTLFSHDIKNSPNSVIICANVASSYIDMSNIEPDSLKKREELHKGVELLKHALTFHTTYVIGYFNLALAYFKLGEADSAKTDFDVVMAYYPKYPRLGEFYYNLGVYYYLHQRLPMAVTCWRNTLKIQPDNKEAIHAMQVVGAK